jgi:hypothetical protein
MMMTQLRQERDQHPAHSSQRIPHLGLLLFPLQADIRVAV